MQNERIRGDIAFGHAAVRIDVGCDRIRFNKFRIRFFFRFAQFGIEHFSVGRNTDFIDIRIARRIIARHRNFKTVRIAERDDLLYRPLAVGTLTDEVCEVIVFERPRQNFRCRRRSAVYKNYYRKTCGNRRFFRARGKDFVFKCETALRRNERSRIDEFIRDIGNARDESAGVVAQIDY